METARTLRPATLAGLFLLLIVPTGVTHAQTLNVVAAHDKPGPVNVRAQGWDASCVEIFDATMQWSRDTVPPATKRSFPLMVVELRLVVAPSV